ncbi:P-loop NTPase family protein [Aminipila luticellarii]|uniref:ATPase n=1 Tax=Aminipila luticellarii TaxID=2507160 RepID=A0A410PW61_9FIRM|nr:Flp pilus assembly complex ATPase component TadA [Aminipila luticellarii]QAT43182.1 ATPase [Aminipila luticellarii]
MEKFYLDQFLVQEAERKFKSLFHFDTLCKLINLEFQQEWEEDNKDIQRMLSIQKNAIIGFEKEVLYFKNKIKYYVKKHHAEETEYPPWYKSLEEAVYHENWGLAGIAEWFSAEYAQSSSCKVIGERIYFQESGKMILKPQTISQERREQLIRAFLLLTPEERPDKDFHELYTLDGTRITVFRGTSVKAGQDVIIFRRYIIPEYTFEEQAKRGTIPWDSIPLFKEIVRLGYSVAVTGAMKSGKTSFLATLQSYEDESLEGVMLETDPEISLHQLIPKAPIVQILAKEDKLKTVIKHLLRSDADYLIMAEARDGLALDTVLRIASKGTRRLKVTFHERNPMNFPYDVAAEIVLSLGGDMKLIAKRTADSFDYIFHFVQLRDKSQKRLKGIYEIALDKETDEITITQICAYHYATDSWSWRYKIGKGKAAAGEEENLESFQRFSQILEGLARKNPWGTGGTHCETNHKQFN